MTPRSNRPHFASRPSLSNFFSRIAVVCWVGLALAAQAAPKVQVVQDVESGIYTPGQTVTWNISITDDGKAADGKINFNVTKGGLTQISAGSAELHDGKAQVTGTRAEAGTLLLAVKFKPAGADKDIITYGGAAFAPEKITASLPPPDDFDAFWKSKIAELDAIPMNVKLERIDTGDPSIEYYKITMDNIRGTKIYGQLAKPAGKTNLPALLQVQWAGVYGLHREWVTGYAKSGWISMDISAHDLPIDEKEAFYKEKNEHELKDYPGLGNDDRETSYFLRMFLSCRRAVDYLAQRSDWNKKSLVVHGGSQGGYQAIVTAGINPAVTAFAANIPAGCDHTGKQAGRSPGWPNWASRARQKDDEQKMLTAARYFDAMNFATRAKCPGIVGLGLSDTTCPAESVLAACNQLTGPKQIIITPQATHAGDHKLYNQALGPFLEQQKQK